jgi:hypothetical protein
VTAEFGGTHGPSGPRRLGVQPPLQLPDRPDLGPLVDNLSTLPSMVMRASPRGLVHNCGGLAILAARERSPQHQWETSATSNSLLGGRRQQWLSPRGGLTTLEGGRSAAPRLRHEHEHMGEGDGERQELKRTTEPRSSPSTRPANDSAAKRDRDALFIMMSSQRRRRRAREGY